MNVRSMIKTVTRFAAVFLLFVGVAYTAPLETDLELMALVPPSRPNSFQNFQEMQRYLMELNNFYHMMSRPRYGRDVSHASLKPKKMQELLHLLLNPVV
ncbi:pro-neuropeptide Y-like [Saccostrea echinata]|uniref:pro-neuropeptide Y-like n=1 Tax=Saccostrea echinata TaxID=191078 RepID=UPI002A8296CA|nr:pro-neuropeptide Y-like [Saccostrea echinata]